MISLSSPVETRAHRWPAGAKLLGLCILSTALLFTDDLRILAAAFAVTLLTYALAGYAFFKAGLRGLGLLLPFVAVILAYHAWDGDIAGGSAVILRMLTLVALANAVTMTTRLSDMVELVRTATAPLARCGVPMASVGLALPLTLRFIPVLAGRAEVMNEAWRARSRSRRKWRLVLPLMLSALDDADHVAEAIRARGGTTKFNAKE